ncbi:MAG: chorismate synthase [Phascolarctobacterium sp.]|nr:chorismate synthase [Phascolarctobacterium sp.]MBR2139973.1 chorismate synthase [Phascolarctobacterium sp.]MBR2219600.1 chorismate synthase [Phascolarctobacterium sp.]
MSGIYGMNIKMAIYGESHGASIGLVIDGVPPGLKLDLEQIEKEMARRAPGKNQLSTQRKESDSFAIQSGFFEGYTTGTPLCVVIKNSDQHSKDYSILKDKMRPGHADYAGFVRYQGFNDYRGGGHFSGRLTAPLVFMGAVAKQALVQQGILVGAHILQIADIKEETFNLLGIEEKKIVELAGKDFAVMDDAIGEKMQAKILEAKADLNSVGGVIEAMVTNVPAGLGAPYFDSVESRLSHALFSVPAVKGVEFGDGFGISAMTGAEANDQLHYEEGKVVAETNHNGGITGGITNGMPVIFRVAIKPTPSISREQKTISLQEKCDTTLTIVGRHDPCIVQRAVPVIEAVTAWTMWDLLLEAKKWK